MGHAYTVYRTFTGEIISCGFVAERNWAYLQAGDNESIYFGDDAHWSKHHMVDGQPVEKGAPPTPDHVFDYSVKAWVDPRTLADLKAQLKAQAAERRWQAEVGGITMGDLVIDTTREARAALSDLLNDMAGADLDHVDFKAKSGFVTLSSMQMRGIARAITLHVQSGYSKERKTVEAIDALSDLEALKNFVVP